MMQVWLIFIALCAGVSAQWCPRGSFSDAGRCKLCPEGTYTQIGNQTMCKACPAGTFSSARGAQGVDLCRKCPPGTYAPRPGTSSCTPCPAGTNSRLGATACLSCPAGEGISFGADVCEPCGFKTYRGENEETQICQECPRLTNTLRRGAKSMSECVTCPDGTSDNFGNGCEACEPRFHRPLGDPLPFCRACPRGSFSSVRGSTACTLCPAGTFKSQPFDAQCKPCPAGTKSERGAIICNRIGAGCPASHFRDARGNCASCDKGFFRNRKTNLCEMCPFGSVSSGGLQTSCTRCRGLSEPNFDRSSCVCGIGLYLSRNGHCSKCLPGTGSEDPSGLGEMCDQCFLERAAPVAGSVCKDCPAGTIANRDHTQCVTCPPGLVARDPDNWLPGEFSFENSCVSPRTNCPPGFLRRVRSGGVLWYCEVESCPPKTFKYYAGCLSCPRGSVQRGKVPFSGCRKCRFNEVSDGGDSQECRKCPDGFVRSNSDGAQCVCEGTNAAGRRFINGKCRLCPPGTFNSGAPGIATCTECPLGTFAPKWGSKACTRCPANTFSPIIGSSNCIPCPEGRTTSGRGEPKCLPISQTM